MKIQINATGQIVDKPLNIAQRWINKGIAHVVKESVIPIKEPAKEVEVVTEIDLIEPIPERFVSFEDEPKVSKPIWKPKKKKSKKITDEDNS